MKLLQSLQRSGSKLTTGPQGKGLAALRRLPTLISVCFFQKKKGQWVLLGLNESYLQTKQCDSCAFSFWDVASVFKSCLTALKHYFEPKVLLVEGLRQAISSITKACAMHHLYPNYSDRVKIVAVPIQLPLTAAPCVRDIHTSCSSAARLWRFLLMKELSWWLGVVKSWHHFI